MAKSSPASLDLNEFLPYRLSVLTNKVSRSLADLYAEKFKLTIPEWRIMAVLGQYADLSADAVCEKTQMDKVTVSRAVTKLLDKNYISRKFSAEDKRRSVLSLSGTGRGVYTQVIPLARQFELRLVEKLSGNELKKLNTLLDKLSIR